MKKTTAVARRVALVTIDLICLLIIFAVAAVLEQFTYKSTFVLLDNIINIIILAATIFGSRFVLSVYTNIWRYANSKAYLLLVLSDFFGGVAAILIARSLGTYVGFWQNASIVSLFNVATLTLRFIYQQFYRHINMRMNYINKIGVAIVGAGQIGTLLAEELMYNEKSHYRPICFIDNSPIKAGNKIFDLKVYPESDEIIEPIKELPVQEIFIALPKIDNDTAYKLYEFYSRTGCKVKLYDLPVNHNEESDNGKRVIREFKIEDLLFRSAMKVVNPQMSQYYMDKVVLVTGGGGSIGSELCRQIAKRKPRHLIIVDIYENNAYDIQQELIRKYGDKLKLDVEIASVRDRKRLEAIFENYRPQIVFHAAAHKHVPLMEHSGCEAIKNNVLGTYNTADMAEKYKADKFILISTDKAVNPTNIMGASKRMCEMIVQSRTDSKTSFTAVRFGNVLGSNGSVIPLFRKQIEKGGPVTITDKRIIRYFMTIPEASQLVMQAGFMAKSGELFVLDMGKPIKIVDLAENMIKLSGYKPYVDIDIVEVGLRPGEKLYEELLIKTEKLDKTENNMIFVERDTPHTREDVEEKLKVLCSAVEDAKGELGSEKIKLAMKSAVPTYRDPEEVNRDAEKSDEMKNIKDVTENE